MYLDPGIPLSLLPSGWVGVEAERLFADLQQALGQPAERFVSDLMG
jgi:phenylacetic acid degradation operon negative regulatory protein